jgi:hypothetical protein
MSKSSWDDDDFAALFLFLSCKLPLLAAIFSKAKMKHFLSSTELQRRDCRFWRCTLVNTGQSLFQRLYHSRNDQSFITFTDVYYATFEYLLTKFRPLYQWYSPDSVNWKIVMVRRREGGPGRPRSLDAAECCRATWELEVLSFPCKWFWSHSFSTCFFVVFNKASFLRCWKMSPLPGSKNSFCWIN